MNLENLQQEWNSLGKTDPLWAILSDPTKRHGKWDASEFFQTGQEWISLVMDYIASLEFQIERNAALDFGCGVGRLTQALCTYFERCYGVDIAPSMIEQANRYNRHGSRCQYILNMDDHLVFIADNSIDFVYSILVLQHMSPRYSKNYIREFLRIVRPGGLVIFQLPGEVLPPQYHENHSRSVALDALPATAYRANITLTTVPFGADPNSCITATPGHQWLLQVRVRNTSDVTWPALGRSDSKYQIQLGNRWHPRSGDPSDSTSTDDGRTVLPHDLYPGEEVDVPLLVTAPNQPGPWVLEVDMIQEGVAWFKDRRGSDSTFVDIDVDTSTPDEASEGSIQNGHHIQMFGLSQFSVKEWIEQNGGTIVDIRVDKMAGQHWSSFTYAVSK
jgi:SAM-dependent methyltransferase